MHRVDTDGNVANLFDGGDPGVPRLPTQVDSHILNAFQEELANAIEGAGITLVKDTNTQLRSAVVVNTTVIPTSTYKLLWSMKLNNNPVYARVYSGVGGSWMLTVNASWDGTNWNPDYASQKTLRFDLSEGNGLLALHRAAAAGAFSDATFIAARIASIAYDNVEAPARCRARWSTLGLGTISGGGVNVASVTLPGSSVIRVTFTNAMPDALYSVGYQSQASLTNPLQLVVVTNDVAYIEFKLWDTVAAAFLNPASAACKGTLTLHHDP